MKNLFYLTVNVKEIERGVEFVENREAGVPGMILLSGLRGFGKTTWAIYHAARYKSVYLRALRVWSPAWMIEELAIELGLPSQNSLKHLFREVAGSLKENPRLIIIDELNIPPIACLDTIRDLHDRTENPFVLMGHEGIVERLRRLGPLFDRFLQIVEFKPSSLSDLKDYAGACLDLPAQEETLAKVLDMTRGNFRKIVILLKGMERRAIAGKAKEISPDHLPKER